MIVKSIKLKNYRNYNYLNMEFGEETNILYGDNAQGKTNILEALYLSGTTKSHRGTKERDLISFAEEEAHIETVIEKKNVPFQIDIHLKKYGSKGIAVNRRPLKRAGELFGIINFVFFSPEDLNIIKAGPAGRRRFMDMELSQLDKVYLKNLYNYNKLIAQRNSLIREYSIQQSGSDLLDVLDEQLIMYGNKIIDRRNEFVRQINEIIFDIHKKLSGEQENIRVFYDRSGGDLPFEEALKSKREKDLRTKSTTVGPHRDDMCFLIGDMDIRKFGSQGQQRTAALSLKLSEIEIVREIIKDTPILLLDDVLSEMDQKRQEYLLESIYDIQALITCTGLDDFVNHRLDTDKIFRVQNGRVVEEN